MQYGDDLDETGMDFLSNVRAAAVRMQALVHDLLAYTQAASIADDAPDACNANEALDRALENLKHTVPEDGVITREQLPDVKMSAVHLTQMFQNLIGNAIKYRSDQPLRVYIRAEHTRDLWQFCVEDNGIGIAAEYREQIRSSIADIQNTGLTRYGGAITAAMFLKEFVEDTPWLHLDIAGLAWLDSDKPWVAKGPSGIGVRSIVEWVRSYV